MKPGPLRPPGFEQILESEQERRGRHFDLDDAYREAGSLIKKEAINPEKLGKPFNVLDIAVDMEYVRAREDEFERLDRQDDRSKKLRQLGQILEAAIHSQTQAGDGWLGPDARTIVASRYDDLKHGVDLIAEFEIKAPETTAHAAIGIDITFGRDIDAKILGIKEGIEREELGTVRYFRSASGSFVGSLNKVPRLVIAMNEESAEAVAKAWYGKNPALKNDSVKDKILIQIIDQCKAFEKYAESIGNTDAAFRYSRTRELFERSYGKEINFEERASFIREDRVFKKLEAQLILLKEI